MSTGTTAADTSRVSSAKVAKKVKAVLCCVYVPIGHVARHSMPLSLISNEGRRLTSGRAELRPHAIPKPSGDGADRVSRRQLECASEVNKASAWVAAQGSSQRVKRLDTRESPDCSACTTRNFAMSSQPWLRRSRW